MQQSTLSRKVVKKILEKLEMRISIRPALFTGHSSPWLSLASVNVIERYLCSYEKVRNCWNWTRKSPQRMSHFSDGGFLRHPKDGRNQCSCENFHFLPLYKESCTPVKYSMKITGEWVMQVMFFCLEIANVVR